LAFASKQSPAVRVFHKNKNTEMIPKLDRGTTNLKKGFMGLKTDLDGPKKTGKRPKKNLNEPKIQ
jgi:hypothetical protein